MNICKRAFLYVTRKRSKTILLFSILLIMADFVLTGLSICKASRSAQAALRQSLGGKFDIFVDWDNSPYIVTDNVTQEYDEKTGITSTSFLMYSTIQLTPEHIAAIKDIPGVKYCSARFDNLISFEDLSLFPGTIPVDAGHTKDTKVLGVCSTEDDELFTSQTLTLTEGTHITPDSRHTAVISQDLAQRNDLHIGDFITTRSYNAEEKAYTGKEIRVQITGLFAPDTIEQFGETVTTYDKIQNRIFVDLQSALAMAGDTINYGFSALNITIDDPKDMERVIADVRALSIIDWEAFTIETDNETYENAASALSVLDKLVTTLLIIISAVSTVILALILTIQTKNRIHEIGVFLSVGIRKSAIIGQQLTEVLLIACLAFGLSCFTNSAIAGQIAGYLLEQGLPNSVFLENNIQIRAGWDNFVQLFLIGLAIITAAISASSITIMRLKPREILSKIS